MGAVRAYGPAVAAGIAAAAAGWTVFGRAPWWPVVAMILGAVAVIAAQVDRNGRRWSVAICFGIAVMAGIMLLTAGRPGPDDSLTLALGMGATMAGIVVAAWMAAGHGATDSQTDLADSLDEVVARMARPLPLDELCQQVVDVLRNGPEGRSVELWQAHRDWLQLTHSRPLVDRATVVIDEQTAAVTATVGTVGNAWLKIWWPDLVHSDADDTVRFSPLAVNGELFGALVVRRQPHDSPFGPEDDRRLAHLQRPVSAVMSQTRLTEALAESVIELRDRNAELQRSRSRLVSVADAERRRLERDLHDGAQAHLTAVQAKLQIVSLTADSAPDRVGGLIEEVRTDLSSATAELRTLAHGLVPPQLVAGGLGDALREAARRSPRSVTVEVATQRRFRPELEAAVYYCCVEALQNVVKHAGPCASAVIAVSTDEQLVRFRVTDDGVGLRADWRGDGQGTVNMADRIGALGGTVTIAPAVDGGVRVAGVVPIHEVAPVDGQSDSPPD